MYLIFTLCTLGNDNFNQQEQELLPLVWIISHPERTFKSYKVCFICGAENSTKFKFPRGIKYYHSFAETYYHS